MPHSATFQRDLHCLLWQIRSSDKNTMFLFLNYNLPRLLDTHKGLSKVDCIKPVGYIGLIINQSMLLSGVLIQNRINEMCCKQGVQ